MELHDIIDFVCTKKIIVYLMSDLSIGLGLPVVLLNEVPSKLFEAHAETT